MLSRRNTIIGLLGLSVGSGALTAASMSSSVSSGGDLRVVLVSELEIIPERPDEAYVEVDEDGRVEAFVLDKLDKRAISRFANLARIRNLGHVTYDEVSFAFEARENGQETPDSEQVEAALQVIGEEVDLHGDTGNDTLLEGDDEYLAPGEEPEDGLVFGLLVNLLPDVGPANIEDLPDADIDVILRITAKRNDT